MRVLTDFTVQALDSLLSRASIDTGAALSYGIRIAVIWGLAWLGFWALGVASRRIIRAVDDGDPTRLTLREKRGHTISQLVRSVGRAGIVLMAALLTLNLFFEIGPLLAGAGVAGLAISFGAQSLVKDLIAGFFILFEDQFQVGDLVELGGLAGRVERLTLRVAVLRDLDGVVHTIPNGQITTVSNRTRGWARAVIEVGVAYSTDLDRALEVFRDEAARFAADPAWRHRIHENGRSDLPGIERLDDSAVVIRIALRTAEGDELEAAREFRRRIKKRLDQEGIEIPFPQRTLHVRHSGDPAPR